MQSTLKELLPRWEVGFLISVFAVGFFITLLSVTVMISDANAREAYCREYQTQVTIAGQPQNAYGTACRKPDGSWQIQRDDAGNARLALTPAPRDVTSPKIIVLPPPTGEVLYLEREVIVLEDWQIEPEIFLFEGSTAHVIFDQADEDIYIAEEPHAVVVVEGEYDDEIIILD